MLNERNGYWRLTFTFRRKRHFLAFGHVSKEQAEEQAAQAQAILARVRSGELELPERMNIATFLTFGGVVPGDYRRSGQGVEFASQVEAGVERDAAMTNAEFQAMLDEPTEETIEWLTRHREGARRAWDRMMLAKLIELLSARIAAGQNG